MSDSSTTTVVPADPKTSAARAMSAAVAWRPAQRAVAPMRTRTGRLGIARTTRRGAAATASKRLVGHPAQIVISRCSEPSAHPICRRTWSRSWGFTAMMSTGHSPATARLSSVMRAPSDRKTSRRASDGSDANSASAGTSAASSIPRAIASAIRPAPMSPTGLSRILNPPGKRNPVFLT